MDVLATLRPRVDALVEAETSARQRYHAGLSVELPLSGARAGFAPFARAESFAAVRERLASAKTPAEEHPVLRAWLALLAREVFTTHAEQALEEVAALEAQQPVQLSDEALPFREALWRLSREPARERRSLWEAALGNFLLAHRSPYQRRLDAAFTAARALGFDSPAALRAVTQGPPPEDEGPSLLAACEALLRSTEDAYQDVLGYALKKLSPDLRPFPRGGAQVHDLVQAAQSPWLIAHYPPGEAAPAVARTLQEWGFHPTAEGRVRMDLDERTGKAARAGVFAVKVPTEVRLVARGAPGGQDSYAALWEATGHALRLANVDADAPVEVRRLGDRAVPRAYGLFFRGLLTLEPWHRRALNASRPVAREAARAAALGALMELRLACALRLYAATLDANGPAPQRQDDFVQRTQEALCANVHKGFSLWRTPSLLEPDAGLRAWALAGRLLTVAEERFNEDFFRNPSSGQWLRAQWRSGQRDDALTLSRALAPAPLSLQEAGLRLMRALGA